MKLALILGITQMTFGIILSIFNHIHFKRYINIVSDFVPQVSIASATVLLESNDHVPRARHTSTQRCLVLRKMLQTVMNRDSHSQVVHLTSAMGMIVQFGSCGPRYRQANRGILPSCLDTWDGLAVKCMLQY